MKKVIIINVIALLLSSTAMAQDKKVAVFDPAGNVEIAIKDIVREEISSVVVNTSGYTVLERSLINKVLEENKFQMGGLVDDSQISEIGKLMGANMAFVTSITPMNNNFYISCKMIEVQTARIEKQMTTQTYQGTNDLVSVVKKMTGEMFGSVQTSMENLKKEKINQAVGTGLLTVNGRKVFMDDIELRESEVRRVMTDPNALRLYNQGLKKNRNGNIWLISGGSLIAVGIIVKATGMFDEHDVYYDDWNNIHEDHTYTWITDIVAGSLGACGVGMGITGIVLKGKSKNDIRDAVDAQNNKGRFSNAELKFGITGNGVGLVLNF